MRFRYAVLAAVIAALSIGTAPAWAVGGELGQTADSSLGTVQVGQMDASSSTNVSTPVNANAPVTVLGQNGGDGGGDASQGAGSSADVAPQSGGGGGQSASRSAGTVQIGQVNASPATNVSTPVNANAPVTVLGRGGGGSAAQSSSSTSAAPTTIGTAQSDRGVQQARRSIATVQIGQAAANPATGLALSASLNAPLTVLARGGNASETGGGSQSAATQSGGTSETTTTSGTTSGGTEPDGSEPTGGSPDGKGPTGERQSLRLRGGTGLLSRLLRAARSMTAGARAATTAVVRGLPAVDSSATDALLDCVCSIPATLLGSARS